MTKHDQCTSGAHFNKSDADEVWKEIPGHPKYQVSNMGRIKGPQKISFGNKNSEGYMNKNFMVNRKTVRMKVHRLVMLCFVGPSDLKVNHKNGIKDDNRLENLEYCTHQENMLHAYKTKLMTPRAGPLNGCAKITGKQALEIRAAYKIVNGLSNVTELSEKYGLAKQTIYGIASGNNWKHEKP